MGLSRFSQVGMMVDGIGEKRIPSWPEVSAICRRVIKLFNFRQIYGSSAGCPNTQKTCATNFCPLQSLKPDSAEPKNIGKSRIGCHRLNKPQRL